MNFKGAARPDPRRVSGSLRNPPVFDDDVLQEARLRPGGLGQAPL